MEADKEKARREIERLTKEFLAKGNTVEQLPVTRVAPDDNEWIARRGFDFTPWRHL